MGALPNSTCNPSAPFTPKSLDETGVYFRGINSFGNSGGLVGELISEKKTPLSDLGQMHTRLADEMDGIPYFRKEKYLLLTPDATNFLVNQNIDIDYSIEHEGVQNPVREALSHGYRTSASRENGIDRQDLKSSHLPYNLSQVNSDYYFYGDNRSTNRYKTATSQGKTCGPIPQLAKGALLTLRLPIKFNRFE